MTKKEKNKGEKQSFLSQDLSLATIKDMLQSRKTKRMEDGTSVPDNSQVDFKPSTPEVNLLPPHVKELYAAQDLGKKFMIGGGALAAIFGILFGTSIISANIYNSKIDAVNAETSSLNTEISSLQPYASYRTAIDGKRQELASIVSGQVDVAAINADFNAAVEASGYNVSNVSLSLSGAEGGAGGSCVNPNPFQPAQGIGCVTFSLSGNGNMNELYSNLNAEDSGFVNVFVPSATVTEEGATLDGSVAVKDAFAVDKYAELALPLEQVLPTTTNNNEESTAPADNAEGAGN